MSVQNQSRPYDVAIMRLQRRVDELAEQCRRFEEMIPVMEVWASRWPTATLGDWLAVDGLEDPHYEMALVALALQGTDEAGDVIDAYDAAQRGEDHEFFYKVARTKWERRRAKHDSAQRVA